MEKDYQDKRKLLDALHGPIVRGDVPRSSQEWGGADVVITSRPPQPKGNGFYPDPRAVVTPYAAELSWLFFQLRDAFAGLIDSCSKIEFYGRLANAATFYQTQRQGNDRLDALLSAVLHEAYAILEEMEDGEFQYLLVASGNTIYKELIEDGEASGYMGTDETQRFFEEMERGCPDA